MMLPPEVAVWRQGVDDVYIYGLSSPDIPEGKKKKMKMYKWTSGLLEGRRCIGSGHGWIVTVDRSTLDLHLHDLVSGSTTTLPSFTMLSDVRPPHHSESEEDNGEGEGEGEGFVIPHVNFRLQYAMENREFEFTKLSDMISFYKKAIYFPSASVVFVIYSEPSRLAFARIGEDVSWNEFDIRCNCISEDVASSFSLRDQGKSKECSRLLKLEKHLGIHTEWLYFCDVIFRNGQLLASVEEGRRLIALDISSASRPKCTCFAMRPSERRVLFSSCSTYLLELQEESRKLI